ncbi:MAG: PEP-CTERM sorting domain-containing protein [Candidatus Aminicenantes bacterium]|nr:PEP-CTERM sorting domain-containing protein [Candidatus Aminicenantes bacterium]
MKQRLINVLLIVGLVAAALPGCVDKSGRFGKGAVDLLRWTAVNYDYPANSQPEAKWVLSEDKQSVEQTVNADPSIFVSEWDIQHIRISGAWMMKNSSDDDLVGFVFGYQNPGQFYLFDWKARRQDDSAVGTAKKGMAVKIVNTPYRGPGSGNLKPGVPFDGKDLWDTKGTEKVTLLHYEPTEGWQCDKTYLFKLDFSPNEFRIVVKDGKRVILDKTMPHSTFIKGKFGFYNFSQGNVVYRGFHTVRLDSSGAIFWWLILLLLLISASIVVLFLKFKRTSREGGS